MVPYFAKNSSYILLYTIFFRNIFTNYMIQSPYIN